MLSSDRMRKLRAGVGPYDYAGARPTATPRAARSTPSSGRRAARSAQGAIVDATFRRRSDTDAFVALMPDAGWIVCEAPPEVLLERARMRTLRDDSVSDAGPAIVAAELARHGRIEPPAPPLARLDTTRPLPELLDRLAAVLDAGFYGGAQQVSADAGHPTAA